MASDGQVHQYSRQLLAQGKAERMPAEAVRSGRPLPEQLQLAEYLGKRVLNEALTFRQHLSEIRGALGEQSGARPLAPRACVSAETA
ncbi:MAG: hypothetical protein EXS42_08750 [Lacunisphaera sp.]|nr:hypothetical protein [Lacunisphaera sp.]